MSNKYRIQVVILLSLLGPFCIEPSQRCLFFPKQQGNESKTCFTPTAGDRYYPLGQKGFLGTLVWVRLKYSESFLFSLYFLLPCELIRSGFSMSQKKFNFKIFFQKIISMKDWSCKDCFCIHSLASLFRALSKSKWWRFLKHPLDILVLINFIELMIFSERPLNQRFDYIENISAID